jgi:putative ABC transport system permease protein
MSRGLRAMARVAVGLLGPTRRAELADRGPGRAPAFFFIDIQPDQAPAFRRLVQDKTGREPTLTPVVRSRLASINGAPVSRDARQRREEVWYLSREYVLTWAAQPPPENPVVAGRWWTPEEAAREPLISVEEEIAKNLGVGIGSTLGFDIQGVTVTARGQFAAGGVADLQYQLLRDLLPGALDGAPTTYCHGACPRRRARRAVRGHRGLPNVTAIPIREVLELTAACWTDRPRHRLLAGVSIANGLIVTAGAPWRQPAPAPLPERDPEGPGATRGLVARVFAVEYALLGAAAGLGGSALAAALAWGVLHWALDVRWGGSLVTLVWGVGASAALALGVGFLGTFRLLGRKPLAVLRSE